MTAPPDSNTNVANKSDKPSKVEGAKKQAQSKVGKIKDSLMGKH
jgi:hypothetical protein